MLQARSFSELNKLGELIPQAILSKPLSYFEQQLQFKIVQGEDDLDIFEGLALATNEGLPFALKHYPGYPPDTTTIYLLPKFRDVAEISKVIRMIVEELRLPLSAIEWQRSDNPEF